MVWSCYELSELKAGTLTTMGAAPCPSEHTGTWQWYVQRTGNTKIQNHSTKQAVQMQEYKNTKINTKGLISKNYKISAEHKKRTHKTQSLSRIPTATWNAFYIINNCQRDEECKCCAKRLQPPLLCPDLVHTIAQSPGQCHTSTWNISDSYFFKKGKTNCPFSSDIGANCKRQGRYYSNHHKTQSS